MGFRIRSPRRLRSLLLSSAGIFACAAALQVPAQEPDGAALAKAVAKAHGFGDMSKIAEIDYTIHAKWSGGKYDRTWQWFPRTDEVIFKGKDPTGKQVTLPYARKKAADPAADANLKTIDGWFVDDGFWILMPLHLIRDQNVSLTVNSSTTMPIAGTWATQLSAEYPSVADGVPGDRFDLFVDSTNLIREWGFDRRNQEPSRGVNKWADYKPFGPLQISLTRPPQISKGLKVWFTDVNVLVQ